MASGLETQLLKARAAARRGDHEAARTLYREILDRYPSNKRALAGISELEALATGNTAQQRLDAMVSAYEEGDMAEANRIGSALADDFPHLHAVHNLLGAARLALGHLAGAESAFRAALAAEPGGSAARNNLAIALRRQGRASEAEALYREAIALAPDYPDARYNLANLLEQSGRLAEAESAYAEAVRLKPDYVDALYNLGNLLAKRGARAEAIARYDAAVAHRPRHSDAHNNRGGELLALDRVDEALAAFETALAVDPANAQALINKGKALVLKGEEPAAIAAFRAALALDPQDASARLQALFEEAQICDWSHRGEFVLTEGPKAAAVQPFAALPFVDDPAHQLRRSTACAAVLYPAFPESLPDPAPATDGRIRIGYFSADFHNHATMYLMSGLFREHDRNRFAVHLFSYGPRREEDYTRAALRAQVDSFTEIGTLGDGEAVALARAANLDIAVDLKGYTRGTRARLFGHRLAPLQVGFMGYPGTSGHACMDYFIADAVSLPQGAEAHFSEKIVRLAGSYQANDNQRAIVPDTKGRAGWGLPETGFVFASFNHLYKITPREWDIWMRLLAQVEGSVLWLLRSNPWAEANLKGEARSRGIDPARLIFSPSIPHGEHLGRLALADLFLDTFAVNAHTTASDALWAGLPVLTLAGRQFAARVAASLLHAADLPELVTTTEADYETTALALARDPQRLGELRARLAANRLTCPLFDTVAYTRRVERAFTEMQNRQLARQRPDHFEVD